MDQEDPEVALKAALLRTAAAESALRRERDIQETMAAMARIGGWELDLPTMRPVWSNEVCRIHGLDPSSRPTLGDTLNLYAPEVRSTVENAMRAAIERGTPYDLTVPLMTHGKQRWVRIMGVTQTRDGAVTRLYGAMQDVTAQREAEDARLAGVAAEKAASRAKADFLANMSHEIRTPMNGVLGMTELLLDTSLESTQREFAETIRDSATSLLGIVNDILDFSKIESHNLEIERVDMSVRECVEDIGMALAAQAAGREIEIIANVESGVPERMLGDAVRLRQVLMNLGGNALKFTQSGEIVIEVFPVALQAGRALISFEIRDTGIGMEPETMKHLFEPFVQGDPSSTRQHGGAGLGLTIVRALVELMGGHIEVSSSPGRGSVFTFTLPFDAIYDAVDPTNSMRVSQHGRRVLVMDDNSTNRRVLRGQLQPAGLDVREAATAAETLKALREAKSAGQPFDVVIVDDQMPDCDGLRFAAQVRADPALALSQLILLTSMERYDSIKSLATAGFAGYLTKPVRGREVLACIERVLDQGSSSGRFQGLVTRSSLTAEQGQGRYRGRVLVVEDNLVNQQVARRFIERLGCEVTVVDNGERAVAACRATPFDLVLMDVQMPVMDGPAATREIRRHESPNRHVPIIALTASAMTDEAGRCIAAGMNAVLAKPLEIGKLRELLDEYGFRQVGGSVAPTPPLLTAPPPDFSVKPIDLDQLRGVVANDEEFLRELCNTFVASSTVIISELASALAVGDRTALSSHAHKLKGGSSSVCAHELAKLAAALEKDSRDKPIAELEVSLGELKRTLQATAGYVAAQVPA